MRLAIVGTGYVGLVSGACFADLGHDVMCVDVDAEKIAALQAGDIPIYEPGLHEMVQHNVEEGRLVFTTDIRDAVEQSLVLFIAVGTPPLPDGHADLTQVYQVARDVATYMDGYRIIVDKSTVPVGTVRAVTKEVRETLKRRGVVYEFDVVSNPEFLKEGAAIEDFMTPDRVVIGSDCARVRILMEGLYSQFSRNGHPILSMSPESAEMTKYAANAMLATRISFMNEMAGICECVGANVDDVRRGIGADCRIGYRFLYPGIGYGGSCFPKDVKAIISTAAAVGRPSRLLQVVEDINVDQKRLLIDRIRTYYHDQLAGKLFCVWGLSFKPETDDVREAPAEVIVRYLLEAGARVRAYDPKAVDAFQRIIGEHPNFTHDDRYYEATSDCDALVLCTEWPLFRNADLGRVRSFLKTPVVFDGRNVYRPELMAQSGFDYLSVGRPPVFAFSGGIAEEDDTARELVS